MIGKICGLICVLSFLFACFTGNISNIGNAVMEGASSAVQLTFSLMGMMCLWNGIMKVAVETHFIDFVSKIMSPVLKWLFRDAYNKKHGIGEIAASISANIFGIGNAATPLAINAMERLQENNGNSENASDDMIMFTVLGTASFDVFPTTLIALRKSAGSANPFEIIVPVWICSFLTAFFAVMLVKVYCSFRKKE